MERKKEIMEMMMVEVEIIIRSAEQDFEYVFALVGV